jgi:methylenetetrahydrofolate reductase (NADPH)
MGIINLWNERTTPTLSFEFFPAQDAEAAQKLQKVIMNLAALNPDFVSVTFGAGGSTRQGSYDLIHYLKNTGNLQVLAYLAAYGLTPDEVIVILRSYKDAGIDSILCVRGDPPRGEALESRAAAGMPHASDLIRFVCQRFDFCLGAAGYPEGHIEAVSKEKEVDYLKLKVDSGAQFVIAQYFYDNAFFYDFVSRCRGAGIQVPIIAGIMPIY